MLSVIFAFKRFHDYVYGTTCQVFNDHQPLCSIFNKSIEKAPPRVQKFLLRLQKYDFDVPGKHLVVTDTISCASQPDTDPEIPDLEMNIHVINALPISVQKLQQFKTETLNNETLQLVKSYVLNRWPKSRHQVHLAAQSFYSVRSDLSFLHDLMLKDERIIVSSSMQKEMKDLLHTVHVGIERCKRHALESIYWPGLTGELTDLVLNCSTCLQYRNAQPKEPLIPHNIPTEVWSKVGTDLFSIKNKNFLKVADYNTKFFGVMYLPDTNTPTVIKHTRSCFAKFGIPKTVFSDNGPQFTSSEYTLFSKQWDFVHDMSSPEFAQSNGFVKRMIQTPKNSPDKTFASDQDPYLALLARRTTPDEEGISPAYRLMNCQPRTVIPSLYVQQQN